MGPFIQGDIGEETVVVKQNLLSLYSLTKNFLKIFAWHVVSLSMRSPGTGKIYATTSSF